MKKMSIYKWSGFLFLIVGGMSLSLSLGSRLDENKSKSVSHQAISNPVLTDVDVVEYQSQIPSWAKAIQLQIDGEQKVAYSIQELFVNSYSTYESFKTNFIDDNNKLKVNKNNCDSFIKESYNTTNNCAFVIGLLHMQASNKLLENEWPDLFIKTNNDLDHWVINPSFFKEDENETDSDDNYLTLNYLFHKVNYGFKKEDITAIPYHLAFSMGMKGVAAIDFSLTRFPSSSPISSQAIFTLDSNPITHYPTTVLATEKIEKISLRNTSLGSLESSSWPMVFSNVKELDLQDNSLNSIPNGFLPTLTSIENLILSSSIKNEDNSNKLVSLPTDFSQINNTIKFLGLANNNFSSNPILPYITDLTNLKILTLNGNPITQLGDLNPLRSSIIGLNLSDTNLSSIGTSLNNLTNLTSLDLSNNSLVTIPNELFTNLVKLTYLNLNENSLTSLPSLEHLTDLITLKLSNNANLENLILDDEALSSLSKLQSLDLSSTMINVARLNLSNSSLLEVFFNDLNLNEVPENILEISTLQRVSFSDNNISSLKIAPSWRRVSFFKNPIKTISTYSMQDINNLIKPEDGSYTYLNWTDNLEAIIFDYSTLDWTKMSDPRILKVRIPLFWDLQRVENFYTATPPGMVKVPINTLISNENIDRNIIPDILPTTLEFELLFSTANSELKNHNDANGTNYVFNDINDNKLAYSFSKIYKGPENFSSISAYTNNLQNAVLVAYNNKKLIDQNEVLKQLITNKNNESTQNYINDRNVIILIVIAIVFALLLTALILIIMVNKNRKLLKKGK